MQSAILNLYGDVAQLGERTVRIRKVESSILFVSTNDTNTAFAVFVLFLYPRPIF